MKKMIEAKMAELAILQLGVYKAVSDNDQSEVRQKCEVILYWIRKEIYREVQTAMVQYDARAAAALRTEDIRLSGNVRKRFGHWQADMLKAEPLEESEKKELWGDYCSWVDLTIIREISRRMGRYIHVRIRKN
jgi:hypothetical protein